MGITIKKYLCEISFLRKQGIVVVTVLCLILTIYLVSNLVYGFEPDYHARIRVVFRYDDFSTISNTELESRLFEEMAIHGASLIVGVVPDIADKIHDYSTQKLYPLNKEKAAMLRKAIDEGIVVVAQHGYSHKDNQQEVKIKDRSFSEFDGVPFNIQLDRIGKGKNYLEKIIGRSVAWFVPPWNSYDYNTLAVLEYLGFRFISAGKIGKIKNPTSLGFLPFTCLPLELKKAVAQVNKSAITEAIIVVLLHQYDFQESNKGNDKLSMDEVRQLLNWLGSQKNIEIWNNNNNLYSADISINHFEKFSNIFYIQRYLPSLLIEPLYYYPSASQLLKIRNQVIVRLIAFYSILLAVSLTIGFIITGFARGMPHIIRLSIIYGIIIIAFSLIMYGLINPNLSFRRALISSCAIGTALGVFIKLRQQQIEIRQIKLSHTI